jgi:NitT/TauT family transport system substrate-binding protein
MQIVQSRRDFLASLSAAGATSILGARGSLADEGPPEVTSLRLRRDSPGAGFICYAPEYVAEELLRTEGFTDIQYIFVPPGVPTAEAFARGELDFGLFIAVNAAIRLDAGVPVTMLAGVHTGCFELFVHGPIKTITDLKGKRVGIWLPGNPDHLFVSIMAAYVGLDPQHDINWVARDERASTMELFLQGEVDAFLASVPEPQELRARKIGHVYSTWLPTNRGPNTSVACSVDTGASSRTTRLRPDEYCAPSSRPPTCVVRDQSWRQGDWSLAASRTTMSTRARR